MVAEHSRPVELAVGEGEVGAVKAELVGMVENMVEREEVEVVEMTAEVKAVETVAAVKVVRMVKLSEQMRVDSSFARQLQRKFTT